MKLHPTIIPMLVLLSFAYRHELRALIKKGLKQQRDTLSVNAKEENTKPRVIPDQQSRARPRQERPKKYTRPNK